MKASGASRSVAHWRATNPYSSGCARSAASGFFEISIHALDQRSFDRTPVINSTRGEHILVRLAEK